MAAAASETPAADWRQFASWEHLVVTPPPRRGARAHHARTEHCRGLHSYLADGRQVCWRPGIPGRFAVDVEAVTAPPAHLAARWAGTDDEFWPAWTTAEVMAKLSGVPMLTLVGRGLPVATPTEIETVVDRHNDLIACFGHFAPIVI